MKSTTSHTTLRRIVLGAGALSLLSFVVGDSFADCVPGWEWSYNSQGLNPCEIAGSLQAPCLGYSVYVLGPLANGTNYVAPQPNDTTAKNCGCNTVIYSLYDACTLCQSNTTVAGNTWPFWSQYCDNVYVAQYPFSIPFNTTVPHWAFLNDTNPGFDATLAQAAGRDPEASPTSPPTVMISSSGSSSVRSGQSTPGGTATPSSAANGGGGSKKSNAGAIAGGVIGGLIGLAALAALAFFFLKRRRAGNAGNILGPNQMGYNPAVNDPQFNEPPKLYDPADPSTFPTPLSAGDSSNSGGYTTNPYQGGRYNGAAEL